jgi:hypothetical protein
MMPQKRNESPCFTCAGGPDCDDCLQNPKNSVPVKLYTPKGAARAMLVGKVLKGKRGWDHFWGKNDQGEVGFFRKKDNGNWLHVVDFSGLYEELA